MSKLDRRTVIVAMLLILAALVLLRAFNIGRTVMYDEAWNVNSIVAAATGNSSDVFYANFLRHPPLFDGLAALYTLATGSGRQGVAIATEVMSIVFAAGVAVVLFFCGRDWFDERTGLVAAFLFAVMPAARMYDSLAKPESLTVLLGLLFLLFFFRGRWLPAGIFLGLAMLTKEIFVFLPIALVLFLLASRRFSRLKDFAFSVGVGAAISFWWYLFVSNSKGEFLKFFLGRNQASANWREPAWFYVARLPDDIGWPVLALCLAAVVFLAARIVREGWPGSHGKAPGTVDAPEAVRASGDRPRWEMALFPVLWIAFVYAFLSLSYGKPAWLVYSALPAFALLGAWGLMEAAAALSGHRWLARAVVLIALAAALSLSIPVGFGSFYSRADKTFRLAVTHREVAEYLNRRMTASQRVLMPVRDFSPNIAFYLKDYRPGSVDLLPAEPEAAAERSLPDDRTVLLYESRTDPAQIGEHILFTGPRFVVMRPGFRAADGADTAEELSRLARPVDIGGVWVFDGREIARELARTGNR